MIAGKDLTTEECAIAIGRLWEPMPPEQVDTIARHVSLRHYKRNELIYNDLESPHETFCLMQGKVKIFKDVIGGRNQIIRVIKPVEFFGYRASFALEDYKTAAMAFEPSVVATLPIDVIYTLMRDNFNVSRFFLYHLSKELGASDDRTVNLTQKHIRGRLAEALLFLKESYGVEEDGHTLNIHLSREDLASLSNMTTSNAIRTLSAFASDKLVAIDGRKIKILDTEELQHVSEIG